MVRETRYLIVRNLPENCTEETIIIHFQRYGKIQSVKLQTAKENDADNTATVAFNDIKSAAKAHNAKNSIGQVTLRTDYWEGSTGTPALTNTPVAGSSSVRSSTYSSASTPASRLVSTFPTWSKGTSDEDGSNAHDKVDISQTSAPGINTFVTASAALDKLSSTSFDLQRGRGRERIKQKKFGQKFEKSGSFGRHGTTTSTRSLEAARSQSEAAAAAAAAVALSLSATPATTSASSSVSGITSGLTPIIVSDSKDMSSRELKESSRESASRSRPHSVASPSSRNSGVNRLNSQSRSVSNSRSRSRGSRSSSCRSRSSGTSQSTSPHRSHTSSTTRPQSMVGTSRLVNSEVKEAKRDDDGDRRPLGICVTNLPMRSTDSSLRDGLYHEYKKHGKVTTVQICGDGESRCAVISFRKPEDASKALEASQGKVFFGAKVKVSSHEGVEVDDTDRGNDIDSLDEYHAKSTRTLFVGNLEKETTTQDLIDKFKQFGDIIDVDIKRQGASTAFAFVQYADISSVVSALRAMEGEHIGINKIKLGFGKSMPTSCVWLDCLPTDCNNRMLRTAMTRYGEVTYCCVDRTRNKGLVYFTSYEDAQRCVNDIKMRPHIMKKKLQIDFASRECQTDFLDRMETSGQLRANERPDESRVHKFRQQRSFDSFQEDGSPTTAYGFSRTTSSFTARNGRSSSGSTSYRRGRQCADATFPDETHTGSRRSRRQEDFSQTGQFYGSKGSTDDYDAVLREYGHSQRERRERDVSPRPSADRRVDSQSRQNSRDHSLDRYDKDRIVEVYNSRDTSPGSDHNSYHSDNRYRASRDEKYSTREHYEDSKTEDTDHHIRVSRNTSPHVNNHSSSLSHDSDYEHRGGSRSQSPPTPIQEDSSIHRIYYSDDCKRSADIGDNYSTYSGSHKPKDLDDLSGKARTLLIHSSKLGAEVIKTAGKSRKRAHEESGLSDSTKVDPKLLRKSDKSILVSDKGKVLSEKKLSYETSRQMLKGRERASSPGSSASHGDSENGSVSEGDLHHLHQEKHHILRKLQELQDEGVGTSEPDSPRSVAKVKSVAVKEALRLSGRSHEDRKGDELAGKSDVHRRTGAKARGIDSRRESRNHLSEGLNSVREGKSLVDDKEGSVVGLSDSECGSEFRRNKKRRTDPVVDIVSVKDKGYRRPESVDVSEDEDLDRKSEHSFRVHNSSVVKRMSCDSRVGPKSYSEPNKTVEVSSSDSGDLFKDGLSDQDLSVIKQPRSMSKSNTIFPSRPWNERSPVDCFSPAYSEEHTQDSVTSGSLTEKSSKHLSSSPWQHSPPASPTGKDNYDGDYGYYKDFTMPGSTSPDDCLSDDSMGDDLLHPTPGEPSVEERIRAIDEMLNMTTSNKASDPSLLISVLSNKDITNNNDNTALYSKFRIRKREGVLDGGNGSLLAERKPEPSVIMQQVLSKKSILDQDFKRLEQMSEIYDLGSATKELSSLLKIEVSSPKLIDVKGEFYLKPLLSPSLISSSSSSSSHPVTTSSSMLQPTVTTSVAGSSSSFAVLNASVLTTSTVTAPVTTCSIHTSTRPAALDNSKRPLSKFSENFEEVPDRHIVCTNSLTLKQELIVVSSSSSSVPVFSNNSSSSSLSLPSLPSSLPLPNPSSLPLPNPSSLSLTSNSISPLLTSSIAAPVLLEITTSSVSQQSCKFFASPSSLPSSLLSTSATFSTSVPPTIHPKTRLQQSVLISPYTSSPSTSATQSTSGSHAAAPFTQGPDKSLPTPTVGQEAPRLCSPSFTPENSRTSMSSAISGSRSPGVATTHTADKDDQMKTSSEMDLTVSIFNEADSKTGELKPNSVTPDIESPISVQSETSSVASVPLSSIDSKVNLHIDDKISVIPSIVNPTTSSIHSSGLSSFLKGSDSSKPESLSPELVSDKSVVQILGVSKESSSKKYNVAAEVLTSRKTELSPAVLTQTVMSVVSKDNPDKDHSFVPDISNSSKIHPATCSSLNTDIDTPTHKAVPPPTATTPSSSMSAALTPRPSLDKSEKKTSTKGNNSHSKISSSSTKSEALFAPDVKMEQTVKPSDTKSDLRHHSAKGTPNRSNNSDKKPTKQSTKDTHEHKDLASCKDTDKRSESLSHESVKKESIKPKDKRDQSKDGEKSKPKDKEDTKKKGERKGSEKKVEKKNAVVKEEKKVDKKEDKKDRSSEKLKDSVKPGQTKHSKVETTGSKQDKKPKEKAKVANSKDKQGDKKTLANLPCIPKLALTPESKKPDTKDSKSAKKDSKDTTSKDSSTKDLNFKDSSTKETSSKDSSTKETSSKDSSTKETSSKDSSTKDSSTKETSSKDSSTKETSSKDSSTKDTSSKDVPTKDTTSKDPSIKDSIGKDSSSKDSNSKDPVSKDSVSKDSTGKEATGKPDKESAQKATETAVKGEQKTTKHKSDTKSAGKAAAADAKGDNKEAQAATASGKRPSESSKPKKEIENEGTKQSLGKQTDKLQKLKQREEEKLKEKRKLKEEKERQKEREEKEKEERDKQKEKEKEERERREQEEKERKEKEEKERLKEEKQKEKEREEKERKEREREERERQKEKEREERERQKEKEREEKERKEKEKEERERQKEKEREEKERQKEREREEKERKEKEREERERQKEKEKEERERQKEREKEERERQREKEKEEKERMKEKEKEEKERQREKEKEERERQKEKEREEKEKLKEKEREEREKKEKEEKERIKKEKAEREKQKQKERDEKESQKEKEKLDKKLKEKEKEKKEKEKKERKPEKKEKGKLVKDGKVKKEKDDRGKKEKDEKTKSDKGEKEKSNKEKDKDDKKKPAPKKPKRNELAALLEHNDMIQMSFTSMYDRVKTQRNREPDLLQHKSEPAPKSHFDKFKQNRKKNGSKRSSLYSFDTSSGASDDDLLSDLSDPEPTQKTEPIKEAKVKKTKQMKRPHVSSSSSSSCEEDDDALLRASKLKDKKADKFSEIFSSDSEDDNFPPPSSKLKASAKSKVKPAPKRRKNREDSSDSMASRDDFIKPQAFSSVTDSLDDMDISDEDDIKTKRKKTKAKTSKSIEREERDSSIESVTKKVLKPDKPDQDSSLESLPQKLLKVDKDESLSKKSKSDSKKTTAKPHETKVVKEESKTPTSERKKGKGEADNKSEASSKSEARKTKPKLESDKSAGKPLKSKSETDKPKSKADPQSKTDPEKSKSKGESENKTRGESVSGLDTEKHRSKDDEKHKPNEDKVKPKDDDKHKANDDKVRPKDDDKHKANDDKVKTKDDDKHKSSDDKVKPKDDDKHKSNDDKVKPKEDDKHKSNDDKVKPKDDDKHKSSDDKVKPKDDDKHKAKNEERPKAKDEEKIRFRDEDKHKVRVEPVGKMEQEKPKARTELENKSEAERVKSRIDVEADKPSSKGEMGGRIDLDRHKGKAESGSKSEKAKASIEVENKSETEKARPNEIKSETEKSRPNESKSETEKPRPNESKSETEKTRAKNELDSKHDEEKVKLKDRLFSESKNKSLAERKKKNEDKIEPSLKKKKKKKYDPLIEEELVNSLITKVYDNVERDKEKKKKTKMSIFDSEPEDMLQSDTSSGILSSHDEKSSPKDVDELEMDRPKEDRLDSSKDRLDSSKDRIDIPKDKLDSTKDRLDITKDSSKDRLDSSKDNMKHSDAKPSNDEASQASKKPHKKKKDKKEDKKEETKQPIPAPKPKELIKKHKVDTKDKKKPEVDLKQDKAPKNEDLSEDELLKPPKKKKKKKEHGRDVDSEKDKPTKSGKSPQKKSDAEKSHMSGDEKDGSSLSDDKSSSQIVDEFTSFWGHPKPILIPKRLKDSKKSDDEKSRYKDESKSDTSSEKGDASDKVKEEPKDEKQSQGDDKLLDESPGQGKTPDSATTPKMESDNIDDFVVPISEAETTVVTEVASSVFESVSSIAGDSLAMQEETVSGEEMAIFPDETTVGSSIEIDDDDFPSLVIDEIPEKFEKKIVKKDKKFLKKQQEKERNDHMDEVIASVAMAFSSDDEDDQTGLVIESARPDQEVLLSDVINQEFKYGNKMSSEHERKSSNIFSDILSPEKDKKEKLLNITSPLSGTQKERDAKPCSAKKESDKKKEIHKIFGPLDDDTKKESDKKKDIHKIFGPSDEETKKESDKKKDIHKIFGPLDEETKKRDEELLKTLANLCDPNVDKPVVIEDIKHEPTEEEIRQKEELEKKKAEEERKRAEEEEKTRREKEEQAMKEASDEAARAVESLLEFQSEFDQDSVDMDDDLPPLFIEPADKESPGEPVPASPIESKADLFSSPIPDKVTTNLDDKLLERKPDKKGEPDQADLKLDPFNLFATPAQTVPQVFTPPRNSAIREKTPEPITLPPSQRQVPSSPQMHSPHRLKFPPRPLHSPQHQTQSPQRPLTSPQIDIQSPQRPPFLNKDSKMDTTFMVTDIPPIHPDMDIPKAQQPQRRVSTGLPPQPILDQPLRPTQVSPRRKSQEFASELLILSSRRNTISVPEEATSVTHLDRRFPPLLGTDMIFSKERTHNNSPLPPPVSISLDHAPHDSNSQSPMQSLTIPPHQESILLSPKKISPGLQFKERAQDQPIFTPATNKSTLQEPLPHFPKGPIHDQMFVQYPKVPTQDQLFCGPKVVPSSEFFKTNKNTVEPPVILHSKNTPQEKPAQNKPQEPLLVQQKNPAQEIVLQHVKGPQHVLDHVPQHDKNMLMREPLFSPKVQPENPFNYPDQNIDFLLNSPPRNNLGFSGFPPLPEANLPPVTKQPDYSQDPLFIAVSEVSARPTDKESSHPRRNEGFPASYYQEPVPGPKTHQDTVTISLQQNFEDDKKGTRKRKRSNKKTTNEDRAAALAEQQAIEQSVQANVDSIRKALNANQAKAAAEKAGMGGVPDKKKTLDAYDFEAHIGQDMVRNVGVLSTEPVYPSYGETDAKPLRSRNERGRGRGYGTRRGRRGRGSISSAHDAPDALQRTDAPNHPTSHFPSRVPGQDHLHSPVQQHFHRQQFPPSPQQQQPAFQRQTSSQPNQVNRPLPHFYQHSHPSPMSSDNSSSLSAHEWQLKQVPHTYQHNQHQPLLQSKPPVSKSDVLSPESNRQDLDLSYGESELIINLDDQPSSTEGKENQYNLSSDGEERGLVPSPTTPKSQRSTRARKQPDYKAIASGNVHTPVQSRPARSGGSPRGLGNGAQSPKNMSPRTRSTENISSSPVVKLEKLEVGRTTRSRREVATGKAFGKDPPNEGITTISGLEDQKTKPVLDDSRPVSKENIYEFVDNEHDQPLENSLRSVRARKKRASDNQTQDFQPQQPQPVPDYMPGSPTTSSSSSSLFVQEPRHPFEAHAAEVKPADDGVKPVPALSNVDAIIDAVSKGNFGGYIEENQSVEPPAPAVSEPEPVPAPPPTRSSRRSTELKKEAELKEKAEKTFIIAEPPRFEGKEGGRKGPTVPPLRIKVAHGTKVEKSEEKHYVIERSKGANSEHENPPLAFTVKLSDSGTATIKPAGVTGNSTPSTPVSASAGKTQPFAPGEVYKNDNAQKKDSSLGLFSGLPQNEQQNTEQELNKFNLPNSQAQPWKSLDTDEASMTRLISAMHPKVAAKVQASQESQNITAPSSTPQPIQQYPPSSTPSSSVPSLSKPSPVTPATPQALKHAWCPGLKQETPQTSLSAVSTDQPSSGAYLPSYIQNVSQIPPSLSREAQMHQQPPQGAHQDAKQPPNAHSQPVLHPDRTAKPNKPVIEINASDRAPKLTAEAVQKHHQGPFGFPPHVPPAHSGQRAFIMPSEQPGGHHSNHFPNSALLKSTPDSRPAKSPSIQSQPASKMGPEVRTQTPPVASGAMLYAGVVSGQPHSLSPTSASPEGQVIERIQNPIRQPEVSQAQTTISLHLPVSHHQDPASRFIKDDVGQENSAAMMGHNERTPSREMAMFQHIIEQQHMIEQQRLQQHLLMAEAARTAAAQEAARNSAPDPSRNIAANIAMRNALESSRNTPVSLEGGRKGPLPQSQPVGHGQPLNLTPQSDNRGGPTDSSRVTPKSTPPAPQSPFSMPYFDRKGDTGRLSATVPGSFMQPSPGGHREGLPPHLYPEISLANLTAHSPYMVGRLPIDPRIYSAGQQPPPHLMRDGVIPGAFSQAFPPGTRFPVLEHSDGKKGDPGHPEQPAPHMLRSPSPIQRQLQADALRQQLTRMPCDLPTRDSPVGFLQRYPVMWQGALALKNDNSYVQMHFIAGNRRLPNQALPQPMQNGALPPLRISQRMRLEHAQLEGVAKRMQCEDHYCILIAVACGRDQMDISQQTRALNEGFITYLLSKQAAGIVNVPLPGSEQVRFVVHIFPPCEFVDNSVAQQGSVVLMEQLREVPHAVIIIATT